MPAAAWEKMKSGSVTISPSSARFMPASAYFQRAGLRAHRAQRLAAVDAIDGPLYTTLSQAGRGAVFALLQAGHYQMLADEDE
ncbi:hypothetical protein LYSHEL_22060 [Lysobacter helvus]|uniref:Uncharacterized protein n=2 Tax=Lysobacteraceae TaxID=32033 RepID=A0ABM7Q777_9GAMM|nr:MULTISPECIES: hypothetical protein [Lysobacter]BCT93183.1 hypothetical protein LYSCAS_22070 [Lysobacter caseinilyticus]BCT96335.1 hypothetical protein LYSHEL_22060 [Lysobacter helvus]